MVPNVTVEKKIARGLLHAAGAALVFEIVGSARPDALGVEVG